LAEPLILSLTNLDLTLVAVCCFLLMNGFSFFQFWKDKRMAQQGGWRTPEMSLLFFASIGGFLGAKLGQTMFRHKTRKQPFAKLLNLTGLLNIGIAVVGIGLLTGWLVLPEL
jgi:uncharacterized membrane protein YsdA (DUF1294 family)